MKRLVVLFAVLVLTATAAANGPRAVQFRGGSNAFRGQQFRNQAFRQPALNALRFAGNLALRGHGFGFRAGFNGFNQFRFNQFNHGLGFRNNFYGAAFRNSYFVNQFVHPVYAQPFFAQQSYYQQPFVQQFAAPVQQFAAETCGAAYVQPFAAYSAFASYPFIQQFGHGHRRY